MPDYQQDDWWQNYVYDTTTQSLDILGARYGNGAYVSPNDPRYQQNPNLRVIPQGGAYPPQYAGGGAFVPGTVSTQGFQVNWWTAALAGLVIGAFVLGKGRR